MTARLQSLIRGFNGSSNVGRLPEHRACNRAVTSSLVRSPAQCYPMPPHCGIQLYLGTSIGWPKRRRYKGTSSRRRIHPELEATDPSGLGLPAIEMDHLHCFFEILKRTMQHRGGLSRAKISMATCLKFRKGVFQQNRPNPENDSTVACTARRLLARRTDACGIARARSGPAPPLKSARRSLPPDDRAPARRQAAMRREACG